MMSLLVQNPKVLRAALPVIQFCDLHYALTINYFTDFWFFKFTDFFKDYLLSYKFRIIKEYRLVVLMNKTLYLQIALRQSFL